MCCPTLAGSGMKTWLKMTIVSLIFRERRDEGGATRSVVGCSTEVRASTRREDASDVAGAPAVACVFAMVSGDSGASTCVTSGSPLAHHLVVNPPVRLLHPVTQ